MRNCDLGNLSTSPRCQLELEPKHAVLGTGLVTTTLYKAGDVTAVRECGGNAEIPRMHILFLKKSSFFISWKSSQWETKVTVMDSETHHFQPELRFR